MATLAASTSEAYLQRERIVHQIYPSVEDSTQALLTGEVRELLGILRGPTWDAVLERYLGEPEN